jgi:hypothetical protein
VASFFRGARGAKNNRARPVHAQSPSKKHPPTSFFFFLFLICFSVFFIAFSGASQQVEFENIKKTGFFNKSLSNISTKKIEKNPCRLFRNFVIVFLDVFLQGEVKNTKKQFVEKKHQKPQKKTLVHLRGRPPPPPTPLAFFVLLTGALQNFSNADNTGARIDEGRGSLQPLCLS